MLQLVFVNTIFFLPPPSTFKHIVTVLIFWWFSKEKFTWKGTFEFLFKILFFNPVGFFLVGYLKWPVPRADFGARSDPDQLPRVIQVLTPSATVLIRIPRQTDRAEERTELEWSLLDHGWVSMAAKKFICTISTMQFELFLCLAKHIKPDLTILFVALLFSLQLHIFTKGWVHEDFW